MKTQLNISQQSDYEIDLWAIRVGLLRNFGTQKKAAEALGVQQSNLSKILSGTIDCNSRLFWLMCKYAGFVIKSKALLEL